MKSNVINRSHGRTHISLQIRLIRRHIKCAKWKVKQKITLGLGLFISLWLVYNTITLITASSKSIDAVFLLGGSIQREIYVSQQVNLFGEIPILISQGSPDPCIRLIFERENAPMGNVWLEKCAKSTFDNFLYGLPILRNWGARKVKLITSGSHVFRATSMAKIILGSHGIWVETAIVSETGRPGNRESGLKTVLDLGRSVIWAGLSHLFQPQCGDVIKLENVDMNYWRQTRFKCERQGNLKH